MHHSNVGEILGINFTNDVGGFLLFVENRELDLIFVFEKNKKEK